MGGDPVDVGAAITAALREQRAKDLRALEREVASRWDRIAQAVDELLARAFD